MTNDTSKPKYDFDSDPKNYKNSEVLCKAHPLLSVLPQQFSIESHHPRPVFLRIVVDSVPDSMK